MRSFPSTRSASNATDVTSVERLPWRTRSQRRQGCKTDGCGAVTDVPFPRNCRRRTVTAPARRKPAPPSCPAGRAAHQWRSLPPGNAGSSIRRRPHPPHRSLVQALALPMARSRPAPALRAGPPPSAARTRDASHVRQQKPALSRGFLSSGRRDSNSGPLVPQTSALTRLRHAPRPGHPSGHPASAEYVRTSSAAPTARMAKPPADGMCRFYGRSLTEARRRTRSPRCLRTCWRRTVSRRRRPASLRALSPWVGPDVKHRGQPELSRGCYSPEKNPWSPLQANPG